MTAIGVTTFAGPRRGWQCTASSVTQIASRFYAAMQAQAEEPPPHSKEIKSHIEATLADALQRSVDYKFYSNTDPADPVPSSDPFNEVASDTDEDETLSQRAKRKRLPDVPEDGEKPRDDGPLMRSEIYCSPFV